MASRTRVFFLNAISLTATALIIRAVSVIFIRLRAENEAIKAEIEVIKKEIALREEKEAARLKVKKQRSSKNSGKKVTS